LRGIRELNLGPTTEQAIMWYTALALVLLVVGIEYGSACSCALTHTQTQFCTSDYVMAVRVKRVENVFIKVKDVDIESERRLEVKEIKYHVAINRIYKLEENEAGLRQNSTVAVLYTSPQESLCGVFLDSKTKYLVGGSIRGPRAGINLCDLVVPWPHVTKQQKRYLIARYGKNCHCQIYDGFGPELDTPEKCKWRDGNRQKMTCLERMTACITDKNSVTPRCKWHNNRRLRDCKAAARQTQLP